MANEEKELLRFVNDPKYREKVIKRIHKDIDDDRNKRIKTLESENKKLLKSRTKEVTRVTDARWEKYADGKVMINRTEGKVKINNKDYLFSSIQETELNMMSGWRVYTTERENEEKNISRISSDGESTCTHLGVFVKLDGFISEVVLIEYEVGQSSSRFCEAQIDARNIISQLEILSKTEVPQSFLKPEEEDSVKAIDVLIEKNQKELKKLTSNKPIYAIPDMYRTREQKEMSDEEYLQYLEKVDERRSAQCAQQEAAETQRREEEKEARRRQREWAMAKKEEEKEARRQQMETEKEVRRQQMDEEKEIRRQQREQYIENKEYMKPVKLVTNVIYNVVFWVLSVLLVFLSIGGFVTAGGLLSGVLFALTGVLINPKVDDLIRNKLFAFPKWMIIVITVVGFLASVLTFPS